MFLVFFFFPFFFCPAIVSAEYFSFAYFPLVFSRHAHEGNLKYIEHQLIYIYNILAACCLCFCFRRTLYFKAGLDLLSSESKLA
jgi:hypothetical protein